MLLEGFHTLIASLPSADNNLTSWLLFLGTIHAHLQSVCFVGVTFPALYTQTSIAAQILWIFCAHNWWDSLANCFSTLAFTDFDIFCFRNAPFGLQNCFSALSSAVRDRSEWFCWLTSRENSHNARTTQITISSGLFQPQFSCYRSSS